jgi:hypothetical protein
VLGNPGREAAKKYSPGRKPLGRINERPRPERAKEKLQHGFKNTKTSPSVVNL